MIPNFIRAFFIVAMLCLISAFHPYYISVTEIKFKEEEKIMQVSCRMFTNDLENAMKTIYKKPVDLLHPKSRAEAENLLQDYISNHLKIKINGADQKMKLIGYEKEEESVWSYLEIKNCPLPKKIDLANSLLYDLLKQQVNMVHTEVKGKKQSSKVTNPDKELSFEF